MNFEKNTVARAAGDTSLISGFGGALLIYDYIGQGSDGDSEANISNSTINFLQNSAENGGAFAVATNVDENFTVSFNKTIINFSR